MVDILRVGKDHENNGKLGWSKGIVVKKFRTNIRFYYLGGYYTDT